MTKLLNTGAWLIDGTRLIEDNEEGRKVLPEAAGCPLPAKEDAAKETIAYGILEAHNTSGNMEELKKVLKNM